MWRSRVTITRWRHHREEKALGIGREYVFQSRPGLPFVQPKPKRANPPHHRDEESWSHSRQQAIVFLAASCANGDENESNQPPFLRTKRDCKKTSATHCRGFSRSRKERPSASKAALKRERIIELGSK